MVMQKRSASIINILMIIKLLIMIKKILILLIISLIITQGYSQVLKLNKKRPAFDLQLFVDDTRLYKAPMGETDYIINDSIIQIFPGEKLFIEADVVNNRLTNFQIVSEIKDKNKTLIIDFKQTTKGKVHEQMILTIDNPFDKQLDYKAMMNLMKNKKWVNTSVYPVMPKLKAIEMWPDLITSLALIGFELKEK
jgi:hypothetical protein